MHKRKHRVMRTHTVYVPVLWVLQRFKGQKGYHLTVFDSDVLNTKGCVKIQVTLILKTGGDCLCSCFR